MSELRFQISDGVMSSEACEVETSVVGQISPLPSVGRNDGGYGAPALGIGAASFFAFRKKDRAESLTAPL